MDAIGTSANKKDVSTQSMSLKLLTNLLLSRNIVVQRCPSSFVKICIDTTTSSILDFLHRNQDRSTGLQFGNNFS